MILELGILVNQKPLVLFNNAEAVVSKGGEILRPVLTCSHFRFVAISDHNSTRKKNQLDLICSRIVRFERC